MRSPSLNIRREKYRSDVNGEGVNGAEHPAATNTASDEELLLAIEHEFELNDGEFPIQSVPLSEAWVNCFLLLIL